MHGSAKAALRISSRIAKASLLQFKDRSGDSRGEHHLIGEMVGELCRQHLVRRVIRILADVMSRSAKSQIALWQARKTTPRSCSAGTVSPSGPNRLSGSSLSDNAAGAALGTISEFD